jgi:hypothetical protein
VPHGEHGDGHEGEAARCKLTGWDLGHGRRS